MRYKARMRPSKLLCPETYAWFDIEPCLLKLDKEKYSRFNDDIDAIDDDGMVDIRKVITKTLFLISNNKSFLILTNVIPFKVLVLHRQIAMPYEIYKRKTHQTITQKEEDKIKQYASLVGMKSAQRLLLNRN